MKSQNSKMVLSGERLFLALTLVLAGFSASGAGYYTIAQDFNRPVFDDQQSPLLALIGTAATVCCLVVTLYGITRRVKPDYLLSILLVYSLVVLASCFWASDPAGSMRLISKSAIYLYATYVVSRSLPPKWVGYALLATLFSVCAFSIALIATDANFAVTGPVPGWRGAFQHKNGLAAFCAFAIAGLMSCWSGMKDRVLLMITAVAAVALLIGSQGKTGIALTGLILAITAIGSLVRFIPVGNRASTFVLLGVFSVTLGAIMILLLTMDTTFTLTGRTLIWKFYAPIVVNHLLVGLGGIAIASSDLQVRAWRAVGQLQPHNSYIAMLLNIGFSALIFYGTFVIVVMRNSLRKVAPVATALGIGTLAAYMIYGMIESNYALLLSFPLMIIIVQSALGATTMARETPPSARSQQPRVR